ncbi:unnamed protein product [Urochloa decumbens]|uniref:Uncharacterized protein n=1 Tax=Urochloa decumbens TaxID=240449 RepID=A0ABC8Y6R7_9POAL
MERASIEAGIFPCSSARFDLPWMMDDARASHCHVRLRRQQLVRHPFTVPGRRGASQRHLLLQVGRRRRRDRGRRRGDRGDHAGADAAAGGARGGAEEAVGRLWRRRPLEVHDAFQHLHHLPHGRPLPRLLLDAPEADLQRALHLRHVDILPGEELPVDDAEDVPPLVLLVRPHGELLPAGVLGHVEVAAAADDLQQHHPVAVDVGLCGDGQVGEPLRRQVTPGAPHAGERPVAVVLGVDELGEPEVGDLGVELVIEEDVLRLDVAVHDAVAALLVEVCDPPRGAHGDGEPRRPRHLVRVGAEEEGVEGAVLHELVDEQAVSALGAEADEADEVEVVRAADGGHLHPELLLPLLDPLQLLHRRHRPVRQHRPVHGAEPAGAKLLLEPLGGAVELPVGELHGRARRVLQQRVLRRRRPVLGAVPAEPPPQRPLAQHQPGHGAEHHHGDDPAADAGGRPRRRGGRRGRVGLRGEADLDEGRAGERRGLVGADEVGHLEEAEARPVGERGGRHAGPTGEAVEAARRDPHEELLRGDLRRVGEELRVVELEHGGVAGAVGEVHLALAPLPRVGGVGELEVERRAPAHRRRAVVAAHAHVAAVAEHLALVRHRRPLLRRRVAAPRRAVGAEVAVAVEAHEPHHVAALAVVAAVRHHHGGRQLPVRQRHDAVRLHRQRRRAQRLVPREGRVVPLVEVGDGRAAAAPLERQVAGALVDGEGVVAGGEVHAGGEVLRHHHRVRGVVERLPQRGRRVLEHQVAALLDGRGGDAKAASVGGPEHGARSVDQLEVAGGREAERAAGVNGRAGARGPDGDAAGVGDGGDEERRGGRGRREGQREGAVGGRPRRRVAARREGRPQRHVRAMGQQREEREAAEESKLPALFPHLSGGDSGAAVDCRDRERGREAKLIKAANPTSLPHGPPWRLLSSSAAIGGGEIF